MIKYSTFHWALRGLFQDAVKVELPGINQGGKDDGLPQVVDDATNFLSESKPSDARGGEANADSAVCNSFLC